MGASGPECGSVLHMGVIPPPTPLTSLSPRTARLCLLLDALPTEADCPPHLGECLARCPVQAFYLWALEAPARKSLQRKDPRAELSVRVSIYVQLFPCQNLRKSWSRGLGTERNPWNLTCNVPLFWLNEWVTFFLSVLRAVSWRTRLAGLTGKKPAPQRKSYLALVNRFLSSRRPCESLKFSFVTARHRRNLRFFQ